MPTSLESQSVKFYMLQFKVLLICRVTVTQPKAGKRKHDPSTDNLEDRIEREGGKAVDTITKAISNCLKEKQSDNKMVGKTVQGGDGSPKREDSPLGLDRSWCGVERRGNPAVSPVIKETLKLAQFEQAEAHILPKQAKPIFLTKIKSIGAFVARELEKKVLNLRKYSSFTEIKLGLNCSRFCWR
ncbi:unnamed protein product [Mytilus coruscus]|uniref:Uncharacterized protein n=1 Tax=Mytilus coruscus TaxID=42192 RepID=A0A6J8ADN9_MYTCO|nr:unnamed protein product [Mytilus coruscus]